MKVGVEVPPELLDFLSEVVTGRVLGQLSVGAARTTPSPYMSIPEAALYLRCSRQRIDDLLSQRRLTRIKEGRRTLVGRDEIEAYLVRSEQRREL